MIRLINNELIKVGKWKILLSNLLFLTIILIIVKTSDSNIIDTSYRLIPFIGILMCIIFGGTISQEIENGTLRYYLTKPIKRWKIYLSKLITMHIFLIIVLSFIIIVYLIILKKIDKEFIILFIKESSSLFVLSILILFISTIFMNTSISVGISIFIIAFSSIIAQILFGLELNIFQYTFLPYMDFNIISDKASLDIMNKELGINLSINRGAIINMIYTFVIYLIGNYIFIKKDIKS
jgi:ABC-2 type transport system permease protein